MLCIQLINANDKQYVSHLSSKRFYASLKIKEMFFGCTEIINETFISLEPLLDTVKGLELYILIMLIGIQQHSNTYI